MEPERSGEPEVKVLPLKSVYKKFRKIACDDGVLEEEGTTNFPSKPNPTVKMTNEQLRFTKNIIREYEMDGVELNLIVEKPKCVSRLWTPISSTKETAKFIGMGIGETPLVATISSCEDAYSTFSRRNTRKDKKCSNSGSGN